MRIRMGKWLRRWRLVLIAAGVLGLSAAGLLAFAADGEPTIEWSEQLGPTPADPRAHAILRLDWLDVPPEKLGPCREVWYNSSFGGHFWIARVQNPPLQIPAIVTFLWRGYEEVTTAGLAVAEPEWSTPEWVRYRLYANGGIFSDEARDWIEESRLYGTTEFYFWAGVSGLQLPAEWQNKVVWMNSWDLHHVGAKFAVLEPNQPPVAKVSVDKTVVAVGQAVQFSSAGSFDPEGAGLTYFWDFGDGSTSTEANPEHAYLQPGTYTVRLVVHDPESGQADATIEMKVLTLSYIVVAPGKADLMTEEVQQFTAEGWNCGPDGLNMTADDVGPLAIYPVWTADPEIGEISQSGLFTAVQDTPLDRDIVHGKVLARVGEMSGQALVSVDRGQLFIGAVEIVSEPALARSGQASAMAEGEKPPPIRPEKALILAGEELAFEADCYLISKGKLSSPWPYVKRPLIYTWLVDGQEAYTTPTAQQVKPAWTRKFADPGEFKVGLRAKEPNRKGTIHGHIPSEVLVVDGKISSVKPELISTGDRVQFTSEVAPAKAAKIATYVWDFGDGSAKSAKPAPVHVFEKGGNFTVTLAITFETDYGKRTKQDRRSIVVTRKLALVIVRPTEDDQFVTVDPSNPPQNWEAKIIGLDPDPTADTEFLWHAQLTYLSTSGVFQETFPIVQHKEKGGKWSDVFPKLPIRGGIWIVDCHATVGRENLRQRVDFALKGTNPEAADIKTYVDNITKDPTRRIMLKAISIKESNRRQFGDDRWPLISTDGIGAGIFQITTGVVYDDHWNWKINADDALKLLNAAFRGAKTHLDKHGNYTADQLKMEAYAQYGPEKIGRSDYYYRWDGAKWVKDPNGRTAYADRVVTFEEGQ